MSYDKAFHKSFHAKLESLQYNATLTITGAIKGCSTQKIYQELGLKSLRREREIFFLSKLIDTILMFE